MQLRHCKVYLANTGALLLSLLGVIEPNFYREFHPRLNALVVSITCNGRSTTVLRISGSGPFL